MKTIATSPLRPTQDYSLYCAVFLARAEKLDALLVERNKQAAAITASADVPIEAKRIVLKSSLSHILNVASGMKYPLMNLGLSLTASFLPKTLSDELKSSNIMKEANRRAEFLFPQITERGVAMLLPHQLRNEQAAAYMHQRKHDALKIAIHTSLQLAMTEAAPALQ